MGNRDDAQHDAWSAGADYDRYMGRWSRRLAEVFVEQVVKRLAQRLVPADGLDWVDVGCGTGALSGVVLARCAPRSLVGIDPSDGFIAQAAATLTDARARFEVGSAERLPLGDDTVDVAVSALAYNFVSDRPAALAELRRITRPTGTVGFYVWDYPGGGVGFMREFWRVAVALDSAAKMLEETARFPFCTSDSLHAEVTAGGFEHVTVEAIEIVTPFTSFDDLWHPFTLGAGPAPGYVATLDPAEQARLRDRLRSELEAQYGTGDLALTARAWSVLSSH